MIRRLRVSSEISEVRRVSDWLCALADEFELERELAFRALLCVDESIGNIVSHALASEREEKIDIEASIEAKNIDISIRDTGEAFNPLEASEVLLPTSVQEAKIGGLGIHLIRHYCDALSYTRVNDENCLTLSFHR